MSFLPGKWDPDVVHSAESSNDFRNDIWRVYYHDYFYKSPWIGNGFTFDVGESEGFDALAQAPGVTDRGYFLSKAFIVSKNFHIGWISLYDAVGIVGGLAFILLNGSMIWASGKFVFGRYADKNSPLFPIKVWLFSSLTAGVVGYFATFGNFSQSMVNLCTMAIILVYLRRIDSTDYARDVAALQLPQNIPSRPAAFTPLGMPSR